MTVIDRLLANADAYAREFVPGGATAQPRLGVAIVVCMDARVTPHVMLGMIEGDAHVIRNAGGVVTADTLRSLAASQHLLGTRSVMVIQHTDCGLSHTTDDEFEEQLRKYTITSPSWSLGAFVDLEESIRTSVALVRSSPFLPHRDDVRGFAFDIETGKLREVA